MVSTGRQQGRWQQLRFWAADMQTCSMLMWTRRRKKRTRSRARMRTREKGREEEEEEGGGEDSHANNDDKE